MAPLIVQLIAWLGFWLAGRTELLPSAASIPVALQYALAVMFGFTAIAHFVPRTRADMIRMVPTALPLPGLLVSATGVAELLGAAGLVLPMFAGAAALALTALLVAMFPANARAANLGLQVGSRRAMPLIPRLLLQLFWIGCLIYVAAGW